MKLALHPRATAPRRTVGVAALLVSTACQADPASAVGAAAYDSCSRVFISGYGQTTEGLGEAGKHSDGFVEQLIPNNANKVELSFTPDGEGVHATLEYGNASYEATAVYTPKVGCTLLAGQNAPDVRAAQAASADAFQENPPPPEDLPWPKGNAPISTPANPQLASTILDGMFGANRANRDNTLAVAVAKDDQLVFEAYLGDHTSSRVERESSLVGFSMTKTVLALGVGALLDDELDLRNVPASARAAALELLLEEPVQVPEWSEERAVSLRQFLNMQTDIPWTEISGAVGMVYASDVIPMLFRNADTAAWVAARASSAVRFRYNTGTSVLLSRYLQEALGGRLAALEFFRDRIFGPAGVSSAVFAADAAGTLQGGSFLHMTARDWLRMGQLVLNRGRLLAGPASPDNPQIVSEAWIDFMLTPRPVDADANKPLDSAQPRELFRDAEGNSYGGHVWLKQVVLTDDQDPEQTERVDVAMFRGVGGQYLIVVPDRRLSFLRLGATWSSGQAGTAVENTAMATLEALR